MIPDNIRNELKLYRNTLPNLPIIGDENTVFEFASGFTLQREAKIVAIQAREHVGLSRILRRFATRILKPEEDMFARLDEQADILARKAEEQMRQSSVVDLTEKYDLSVVTGLLDRIREVMEDSGMTWHIDGITDEPQGIRQTCDTGEFDHEYCAQRCDGEDFYYGQMYFPYAGKYICVAYSS